MSILKWNEFMELFVTSLSIWCRMRHQIDNDEPVQNIIKLTSSQEFD